MSAVLSHSLNCLLWLLRQSRAESKQKGSVTLSDDGYQTVLWSEFKNMEQNHNRKKCFSDPIYASKFVIFFVCFCYHGPQFFLSVFFRPHPPSAIRRYPVRVLQTPCAVCCSFSMSCPECSWISLEWSLLRLFSVVCLRLYYSRWKSGLI